MISKGEQRDPSTGMTLGVAEVHEQLVVMSMIEQPLAVFAFRLDSTMSSASSIRSSGLRARRPEIIEHPHDVGKPPVREPRRVAGAERFSGVLAIGQAAQQPSLQQVLFAPDAGQTVTAPFAPVDPTYSSSPCQDVNRRVERTADGASLLFFAQFQPPSGI